MIGEAARLVATFFYFGYLPVAPGTWGSIAGLLLAIACSAHFMASVGLAIVLFVVAIWSADRLERQLGQKDPSVIIIDEVLGMFVCLLGIPLTLSTIYFSFFLFRFLDIIKPFPARRVERLPAGWGILADDLVCAFYVQCVLRLVHFVRG